MTTTVSKKDNPFYVGIMDGSLQMWELPVAERKLYVLIDTKNNGHLVYASPDFCVKQRFDEKTKRFLVEDFSMMDYMASEDSPLFMQYISLAEVIYKTTLSVRELVEHYQACMLAGVMQTGQTDKVGLD